MRLLFVTFLLLSTSAAAAQDAAVQSYGGRDMIVYVPAHLPPMGTRGLVIILHGGMGNAERIADQRSESGLNMNAVAERSGFIVAYLNGTPVTRFLGAKFLGWNAGGGCCGQPAQKQIDDISYIKGAVEYLAGKYGVDRGLVYGMGHSNGAMMTQRLVCETNLYAAAVAISGPLNLDISNCPAAMGKRILAIHGAADQNVPIEGGRGTKGLSNAVYNSESQSKQVFVNSGATYTLQIVPGVDHKLDHIEAAILKAEGRTIAQKAAAFFGIVRETPER